jgi:farnesol dehydrogenase
MDKIMVTGATGFIGRSLSLLLADSGYIVHALYRSEKKMKGVNHSNIVWYKGDVTDENSLYKAMEDCKYVFHLAAFAQVWAPTKKVFYDINVDGARKVFESAKKQNVKRVVFTSTAGVIGPSYKGVVDEDTQRTIHFFSDYEHTKNIAERVVMEYVNKGMDIVIVNPTRVYGPGELSVSNSVTKMINQYVRGKFRFLPGNGRSIGNYVYVDDAVKGHVLALEHGKPGERYILGGSNVSYVDFFKQLSEISQKKYGMLKLPLSVMIVIAYVMLGFSKITGTKPLITPGWVRKFNHHWNVSSAKAEKELDYHPVSIQRGMQKTLEWLKTRNTINTTQ